MTDTHDIKAKIKLAQLRKLEAEADAAEHDAITSRLLAESADLSHMKDRERMYWERAGSMNQRVLHFTESVTPSSVATACDLLAHWSILEREEEDAKGITEREDRRPFTIEVCSPGGSVVAGFKLYSAIVSLAKEREVITVATGICASMATVLHAAGSTRLVDHGCSYLIHDPSSGAMGSVGDLEDVVGYMTAIKNNIHTILAERSNLSVKEIAERSQRRDWWLLSDEVVELGFADRVR